MYFCIIFFGFQDARNDELRACPYTIDKAAPTAPDIPACVCGLPVSRPSFLPPRRVSRQAHCLSTLPVTPATLPRPRSPRESGKMAARTRLPSPLALLLCLCTVSVVRGFYIPGVVPTEYEEGDTLEINVRFSSIGWWVGCEWAGTGGGGYESCSSR